MRDDESPHSKQTTNRLLAVLVSLLDDDSRPRGGHGRKIRSCLCSLLGNLMETLSRREDAELLQCQVLVNDTKRHWRIKLYMVPESLDGRSRTRVRTVAERFRD